MITHQESIHSLIYINTFEFKVIYTYLFSNYYLILSPMEDKFSKFSQVSLLDQTDDDHSSNSEPDIYTFTAPQAYISDSSFQSFNPKRFY